MRHLVLKLIEPTDIAFWPGQYVDIAIPGTDATRSFSMANTSSKESGQLEFVIRCYPDGKFSHFLDQELDVGDQLDLVGPFGVFTLRDGRDSDIVFVGGGAGMAPILAVLRSLAEKGSARKATFYYGARSQKDLCFEKELNALTEQLPNFRYVPALSEADDEEPWEGEVGLITDIVKKYETDLTDADSYVCGPPPMVEAAMDVLGGLGAPEKNIYYDKFTTPGSTD
jgi:propane monooxygenase reductase subunit